MYMLQKLNVVKCVETEQEMKRLADVGYSIVGAPQSEGETGDDEPGEP